MKLGDILKVTRDDVQDFPGDTVDLIMDLQKEGWRAQRSNRNHVMLLAPDGVTRYSASRNASSAKYLAEDIARYKKGDKLDGVNDADIQEKVEHEHDFSPYGNRMFRCSVCGETFTEKDRLIMVAKKVPCPHTDCPRVFISQEKVNVHLAVDHEGHVKCPDCDETRENNRKLSIHRTHAHGYESPRKAQRKRQEAARREKDGVVQVYLDGASDELVSSTLQTRGEIVLEAGAEGAREAGESTGRAIKNVDPSGVKFDKELIFDHLSARAITDSMAVDSLVRRDGISELKRARGIVDDIMPEVEPLEFIDERDSWTLDLESIMDMDIRTVARVLHAAGLKLEMRSWVADKGD